MAFDLEAVARLQHGGGARPPRSAAGPSITSPARQPFAPVHAVLEQRRGAAWSRSCASRRRARARRARAQRGQRRPLERVDDREAQVQELHLHVGRGVAVGALVGRVEAARAARPSPRGSPPRRSRCAPGRDSGDRRRAVVDRAADRRQDGLDLALHLARSAPPPTPRRCARAARARCAPGRGAGRWRACPTPRTSRATGGMMTRGMPSSRAIATACSGPPPP